MRCAFHLYKRSERARGDPTKPGGQFAVRMGQSCEYILVFKCQVAKGTLVVGPVWTVRELKEAYFSHGLLVAANTSDRKRSVWRDNVETTT